MPNSGSHTADSLAAARAGSRDALGELLEKYRNYLLLIAQQEIAPELRAKEGASDLVQQTFLEAQRDFPAFQGTTEEELTAWLRRLLFNNLTNFARRYRSTGKREIAREVPQEAGRAVSEREQLPAATPTPSEQVDSEEQARLIRESLERLPSHYRRILLLRCRDNLSFEEISRRIKRSPNAAQKLWARAVERLQREMGVNQ